MKRGSITVYLSLSLTMICSLFLTVLESCRIAAIRMRIEMVMDMGMNSIFAEYNRELLDDYDLFFIDASYGKHLPALDNISLRLREYLDCNFSLGEGASFQGGRDFLSLKTAGISLEQPSLATDQEGAVFRRQAVTWMKEKVLLNDVEAFLKLRKEADEQGLETRDIEKERQQAHQEVDEVELPMVQVSEEEWQKVSFDNPADKVNATRGGVLSLVLEDTVSGKKADLTNTVSKRANHTGIGMVGGGSGELLYDDIIFLAYITDKFSSYSERVNEKGFAYEVEYILEGHDNDYDNLKGVIDKLLLLREVSNFIYLSKDAAKQKEAEALAVAAAGALGMPYLIQLIKLTILFAWAYAESVVDVRALLKGGRVPLMKAAADWRVEIGSLLEFEGVRGDQEEGRGLSYEDYLKLFLIRLDKNQRTMRCLDMIELSMNDGKNPGYFRMDYCYEHLEANVEVQSGFGYDYQIRRSFLYQINK